MQSLFIRWIAIFTCTVLLSACASAIEPEPYSPGQTLQANEGWVAFPVASNWKRLSFYFIGKEYSFRTPDFEFGQSLKIVKVPADTYELRSFYLNTINTVSEDSFSFVVEPGKLTYFGYLVMQGRYYRTEADGEAFMETMEERFPELVRDVEIIYSHKFMKDRRELRGAH